MGIQAAEISKILKEQIRNFGKEAEVAEVGTVLSVGDGIARVHGLENCVSLERLERALGRKTLEVEVAGELLRGWE